MNKQAVLQEVYNEAFYDEMDKLAESDDEVVARIARLGRGLKNGSGRGKGMLGGLRRNKNTSECKDGGPGKGEGEGQGSGKNRKQMDKVADSVAVPEGGLKPGLFFTDLTQTMSDRDAERVKKNVNVFKRSGPGLLPLGATGAVIGSSAPSMVSDIVNFIKKRPTKEVRLSGEGALIGASVMAGLPYLLSRLGVYDKQALRTSQNLVDEKK